MISITGTKEEIIKFIDEMFCECPSTMINIDCEDYKNCAECVFKNEKRFKFIIE